MQGYPAIFSSHLSSNQFALWYDRKHAKPPSAQFVSFKELTVLNVVSCSKSGSFRKCNPENAQAQETESLESRNEGCAMRVLSIYREIRSLYLSLLEFLNA